MIDIARFVVSGEKPINEKRYPINWSPNVQAIKRFRTMERNMWGHFSFGELFIVGALELSLRLLFILFRFV